MYRLEIMDKMIKAILSIECKHKKINNFNNGNHCPDCGNKIKISWITIRCQSCKAIRKVKIKNINEIVPLNKYCINCGSKKWFSICSDEINFSDRGYGIAIKEIIKEDNISDKSKTEVWVEKSEKLETKRYSNVIKSSKRFK